MSEQLCATLVVMTKSQHPVGLYVKDSRVRRAYSASDAVALVFEGYVHVEPDKVESDDLTYRDLQRAAMAVGIPANQSTEELLDALAAHENATIGSGLPDPTDRPTPDEAGGDSPLSSDES